MDERALTDRHLRLADGAVTRDFGGMTAEEMQDADAFLPAFAARRDEAVGAGLAPCRHHVPIVMPHGPESIPIPRVAPYHPVFDQLPDLAPVFLDRGSR